MTEKSTSDYTPFSRDPLIHGEVARLIGKWSVEYAIETGTYFGRTSLALSLLCKEVVTIEKNPANAITAEDFFRTNGRRNIRLFRGSSEKVIGALKDELAGKRSLYYLDAHWESYWPLLDELKAIASIDGPKPIIVIHDFQVPGRPDLGFDAYGGKALNLAYVQAAMEEVYRGHSSFHFNTVAFGARRGVLFVEPTY